MQEDVNGRLLYQAYIEIAGKMSTKNKKDLGVPIGEDMYNSLSSFPVLPKSLISNLSNTNSPING